MTPEQLAQIAYEAYHINVRINYTGLSPYYKWHELSNYEKAAWIAAAQAVKANVLSGFTKVGEGESSV